MKSYIETIQTALLLFPLVAFFFTVPYMAFQYHRYGSIPILRSVVIYSFVLYMMCTVFLTMLPLPSIEAVRRYASPTYRLIPFYDFVQIFKTPQFSWSDPSTWYRLIWNGNMFQLAANVAMLVPFGVYLHYYFGLSLGKTALLSFCFSLTLELIQLSGLFFIYPRPYRLFEVDDLITNTLGGVVGYLISPWLTHFLPSRERLNSVAFQRSRRVSLIRRLFAAGVDCVLLFIIASVAFFTLPELPLGPTTLAQKLLIVFSGYSIFVLLYFGVLIWLMHGRSPGKLLSRIRLVDTRTMGRPKLWQCIVRYGVFYLVVVPAPMMAVLMLFISERGHSFSVAAAVACILLMLVFVGFCALCVFQSFIRGGRLPHGWFSKTDDISTLPVKTDSVPQDRKTEP